jgi:hypothetical protein
MLGHKEIKNRVGYHAPSEEGVERHRLLSAAFGSLLATVDALVPDGREKSLAITNAEQAKMWASAGVARNPDTV